jgi:putative tryptophan/tyrosine transport system substrate-binding protein
LLAVRRRGLLAVRAQQKAIPVIGFLGSTSLGALGPPVLTAFHQGLSETGYVEEQNVTIEYRWAEGSYDRLPAMAADLVSRKVDLIVASGPLPPAWPKVQPRRSRLSSRLVPIRSQRA